MGRRLEIEIKVGFFVAIGITLLMLSVLFLGGAKSIFTRQTTYYAHFANAQGIVTGSKVELNGIKVGTVEKMEFDHERQDIKVTLGIETQYKTMLREDSTADQLTQGVLGDKYIALTVGDPQLPEIAAGGDIPAAKTKGLKDFITDGGNLVSTLNRIADSFERTLGALEDNGRSKRLFEGLAKTATNFSEISAKINKQVESLELADAVKNLNSILKKINNGTGSIGAFINDPSLYDETKSLVSGVNRNRIMRNLVRQTVRENNETLSTPAEK